MAIPIHEYNDITLENLSLIHFDNTERAGQILRGMSGNNVPDTIFNRLLPVIISLLAESADPDRALSNLGRWADASSNRSSAYMMLAGNPAAAGMLLTIFATSQFISNLLINTPEYFEILTNPRIRDRKRGPEKLWEDITRRVNIGRTPNAKRDALRRFKPPEVIRIGTRDLLGFADLVETTQAISDFADASLRMALQIACEEQGLENPPFAVIAMGKLGGRELNYSSDIDLIFVHGDVAVPGFNPIKLAEATRDNMARVTDAGFVFRVDLRLRPEGRFGAISRSLESCKAYYESWGEPWERQALLKARFVAGDPDVGKAFIQMAESFAYRSLVEESFIESIRDNKRRIEAKVAFANEASINVKEGYGGIRDVEFTVQLLQLIAGGKNPNLRTQNTVLALERLQEDGLLSAEEASVLTESYIFLRDVEHRLQILDELPIRNIPSGAELEKFARRLRFANCEGFLKEYKRHTSRVRQLCERLFFDDKSMPINTDAGIGFTERILDDSKPEDRARIKDELGNIGFHNPDAVISIVEKCFHGSEYGGISPGARSAFLTIADNMIRSASSTSDPDTAINGINALAEAVPSRMALFRSFEESPSFLPQLSVIASDSPYLWQVLLQHQELFDLMADGETVQTPVSLPEPLPKTQKHLAQWIIRNRMRTGVRDIWKMATLEDTFTSLTAIGEVAIETSLRLASEELGFTGKIAVIGMGKLGGSELGYGSDLDVLYVTDPASLSDALKVVKLLQQILKSGMIANGISIDIDARLRPDGRKGAMALDIDSYVKYWHYSAATWERQAMIKARTVAGSRELGAEFIEAARKFVYGTVLTRDTADEIISMKGRIEKERGHSGSDVKLAHGGLTDIEWIAQLYQLRYGHSKPKYRKTNTLRVLTAFRDDAKMRQDDWEILDKTYRELTLFRNRSYLKHGVSTASDAPSEELRELMAKSRDIFVRLFTP